MEPTVSFGYWLRRQRKVLDLTQQALADQVGCSLAAIKKIEQDERRPSRQIAELLADVLGVPSGQREIFLEVARGLRPVDQLVPAQEPATSALPTGIVTFLFTDMAQSTKLAQAHAEEWEKLRARHHAILRETVGAQHGYIFQIVGDAFCVAFDAPSDALQAAIEAQRKLQTENWGQAELTVRMGIHTGEAEVHVHSNEYHGYLTLSLVQRLMSAGHGGQILVSQATENLVRGHLPRDVDLLNLGEHKLKDILQPVRVFQVITPDLQKEFPPLRTRGFSPNNLPLQLTSFIGREKEIAEVIRLFEKARLVTLTGPGGTGKTRLSIQVGNQLLDQYPDGVWMVELAPILDPLRVPRTTAVAIGLRDEPHRPVIDMLCDYLREKRMLLLLDNCEHVIEACAQLADTILHACPQIRILTTSREGLGIAGETLYLVPSLTRPDIQNPPSFESLNQYEAIKLFLDRATSVIPTFTLTDENASSIAQICQRLDGIPLAIELAASKIRALSVQQIAQRLDDRFHLLTGGSRTSLPRHQTLQAAIDWSYNLLSPFEQILFRRSSIFVGGWTLGAAESVCSDKDRSAKDALKAEDILDLLTQLVNKSLVSTEIQNGEVRYHILETIRRYAGDKLLTSGESEQVRDRHLDFFIRFAETADPKLRSGEQLAWFDRVETEHDNLRTALAWSLESRKSNRALQLAGAVSYFWSGRSYSREKQKWLDEALALANHEGRDTVTSGETRAETAWRARVLFAAGQNRFVTILDPMASLTMVEESLHLWRELDDKWWMAVALEHIAFMLTIQGDHQAAQARAEEGVSLAREVEDHWPLAICLTRLVSPFMRTDVTAARQIAEEGVSVARSVGDKSVLSFGLICLASTYLMDGNFTGAAPVIEEALVQARLIRSVSYITLSLLLLIFIRYLQGDYTNIKGDCLELLSLAREIGAPFQVGYVLLAFGLATGLDEHPSRGVRLLAACEAAYRQSGIRLSTYGGPLLMIYNHALARAQAQLDPVTFALAFAEGQKMSLDEALDLALKIVEEM